MLERETEPNLSAGIGRPDGPVEEREECACGADITGPSGRAVEGGGECYAEARRLSSLAGPRYLSNIMHAWMLEGAAHPDHSAEGRLFSAP